MNASLNASAKALLDEIMLPTISSTADKLTGVDRSRSGLVFDLPAIGGAGNAKLSRSTVVCWQDLLNMIQNMQFQQCLFYDCVFFHSTSTENKWKHAQMSGDALTVRDFNRAAFIQQLLEMSMNSTGQQTVYTFQSKLRSDNKEEDSRAEVSVMELHQYFADKNRDAWLADSKLLRKFGDRSRSFTYNVNAVVDMQPLLAGSVIITDIVNLCIAGSEGVLTDVSTIDFMHSCLQELVTNINSVLVDTAQQVRKLAVVFERDDATGSVGLVDGTVYIGKTSPTTSAVQSVSDGSMDAVSAAAAATTVGVNVYSNEVTLSRANGPGPGSVAAMTPSQPTEKKTTSQQRPVRNNLSAPAVATGTPSRVAAGSIQNRAMDSGDEYCNGNDASRNLNLNLTTVLDRPLSGKVVSSWCTVLFRLRNATYFGDVCLRHFSVPDTVFLSMEVGLPAWVSCSEGHVSLRRRFTIFDVLEKFKSSGLQGVGNVVTMYSPIADDYIAVTADQSETDTLTLSLQRTNGSFLQPFIQPYDLQERIYSCSYECSLADEVDYDASSLPYLVDAANNRASRKYYIKRSGNGEGPTQLQLHLQTHVCRRLSQCMGALLNAFWLDQHQFVCELWADFMWDMSGIIWLVNITKVVTINSLATAGAGIDGSLDQSTGIGQENIWMAPLVELQAEDNTWNGNDAGANDVDVDSGIAAPNRLCFECDARLTDKQKTCWNCGNVLAPAFAQPEFKIDAVDMKATASLENVSLSKSGAAQSPSKMKPLAANSGAAESRWVTGANSQAASASSQLTAQQKQKKAMRDAVEKEMNEDSAWKHELLEYQHRVAAAERTAARDAVNQQQNRRKLVSDYGMDASTSSSVGHAPIIKRGDPASDPLSLSMSSLDEDDIVEVSAPKPAPHNVRALDGFFPDDLLQGKLDAGPPIVSFLEAPTPQPRPHPAPIQNQAVSVVAKSTAVEAPRFLERSPQNLTVTAEIAEYAPSAVVDKPRSQPTSARPTEADSSNVVLKGSSPTSKMVSVGSPIAKATPSPTPSKFVDTITVHIEAGTVWSNDVVDQSDLILLEHADVMELLASTGSNIVLPPFLHCLFKQESLLDTSSSASTESVEGIGTGTSLALYYCAGLTADTATITKQTFSADLDVESEEYAYLMQTMLVNAGTGDLALANCVNNAGEVLDTVGEQDILSMCIAEDDSIWRVGNAHIQQGYQLSHQSHTHSRGKRTPQPYPLVLLTCEYAHHADNDAQLHVSASHADTGTALDMNVFSDSNGNELVKVQHYTRQVLHCVQSAFGKVKGTVSSMLCKYIVHLDDGVVVSPAVLSSVPFVSIIPSVSSQKRTPKMTNTTTVMSDWAETLEILNSFNVISLGFLDSVFPHAEVTDSLTAHTLRWYSMSSSELGKLHRKQSKYVGNDVCQQARHKLQHLQKQLEIPGAVDGKDKEKSPTNSRRSPNKGASLFADGVEGYDESDYADMPLFSLISLVTGDPTTFLPHMDALQMLQPAVVPTWASSQVFVQEIGQLLICGPMVKSKTGPDSRRLLHDVCQLTCAFDVDSITRTATADTMLLSNRFSFAVKYFETSEQGPSSVEPQTRSHTLRYVSQFSVGQRRQHLQGMKMFAKHVISLLEIVLDKQRVRGLIIKFFVNALTGSLMLSNVNRVELTKSELHTDVLNSDRWGQTPAASNAKPSLSDVLDLSMSSVDSLDEIDLEGPTSIRALGATKAPRRKKKKQIRKENDSEEDALGSLDNSDIDIDGPASLSILESSDDNESVSVSIDTTVSASAEKPGRMKPKPKQPKRSKGKPDKPSATLDSKPRQLKSKAPSPTRDILQQSLPVQANAQLERLTLVALFDSVKQQTYLKLQHRANPRMSSQFSCFMISFLQLLSSHTALGDDALTSRMPPCILFDQAASQTLTLFTDSNKMLKKTVAPMPASSSSSLGSGESETADGLETGESGSALSTQTLAAFARMVNANSSMSRPLYECKRNCERGFLTTYEAEELLTQNSGVLCREHEFIQLAVAEATNYYVCEYVCYYPGSVVSPILRFGRRFGDGSMGLFSSTDPLVATGPPSSFPASSGLSKLTQAIQRQVRQFCDNVVLRLADKDNVAVATLFVDFVCVYGNDTGATGATATVWVSSLMCVGATPIAGNEQSATQFSGNRLSVDNLLAGGASANEVQSSASVTSLDSLNSPTRTVVHTSNERKWTYESMLKVEKSITCPFKKVLALAARKPQPAEDEEQAASAADSDRLVLKINVAACFVPFVSAEETNASSTANAKDAKVATWVLYQFNAHTPCTRKKLQSKSLCDYFRTHNNAGLEAAKGYEIVGLVQDSMFGRHCLVASECKECLGISGVHSGSNAAHKRAQNLSTPTSASLSPTTLLLSPLLVGVRVFHRCVCECSRAGSCDVTTVSFDEFKLSSLQTQSQTHRVSYKPASSTLLVSGHPHSHAHNQIVSKPSDLAQDHKQRVVDMIGTLTAHFRENHNMFAKVWYVDVCISANGSLCVLSIDLVHTDEADEPPIPAEETSPRMEEIAVTTAVEPVSVAKASVQAVAKPALTVQPTQATAITTTAEAPAHASLQPSTVHKISATAASVDLTPPTAALKTESLKATTHCIPFVIWLHLFAKLKVAINCCIQPTLALHTGALAGGSSVGSPSKQQSHVLFYTDTESTLCAKSCHNYQRISTLISRIFEVDASSTVTSSSSRTIGSGFASSSDRLLKRAVKYKDLVTESVTDKQLASANNAFVQLHPSSQASQSGHVCIFDSVHTTANEPIKFGSRNAITGAWVTSETDTGVGSPSTLSSDSVKTVSEIVEYLVLTMQTWLSVEVTRMVLDFTVTTPQAGANQSGSPQIVVTSVEAFSATRIAESDWIDEGMEELEVEEVMKDFVELKYVSVHSPSPASHSNGSNAIQPKSSFVDAPVADVSPKYILFSFIDVLMIYHRLKIPLPYDIRFSSWCARGEGNTGDSDCVWYLAYNDATHVVKKKKVTFDYVLEKTFRKGPDDTVVGRLFTTALASADVRFNLLTYGELKKFGNGASNSHVASMINHNNSKGQIPEFIQPTTIGLDFYYVLSCSVKYKAASPLEVESISVDVEKRDISGGHFREPITFSEVAADIKKELKAVGERVISELRLQEKLLVRVVEVEFSLEAATNATIILNITARCDAKHLVDDSPARVMDAAASNAQTATSTISNTSADAHDQKTLLPNQLLTSVVVPVQSKTLAELYMTLVKAKASCLTKASSLVFSEHGKDTLQVFATDPTLVFRKKGDVAIDVVLKKVLKVKENVAAKEIVAFLMVVDGPRQTLNAEELHQVLHNGSLSNENMCLCGRAATGEEKRFAVAATFHSDGSINAMRVCHEHDIPFDNQHKSAAHHQFEWFDLDGSKPTAKHLPAMSVVFIANLREYLQTLATTALKDHCASNTALKLSFVFDDDNTPVCSLVSFVPAVSILGSDVTTKAAFANVSSVIVTASVAAPDDATASDNAVYYSSADVYSMLVRNRVAFPVRSSPLIFYDARTDKYTVIAGDATNSIRKKADVATDFILKAILKPHGEDPVVGFVHIMNGVRKALNRADAKTILRVPGAEDSTASLFPRNQGFVLYARAGGDELHPFVCECSFVVTSLSTGISSTQIDQTSLRYGRYNIPKSIEYTQFHPETCLNNASITWFGHHEKALNDSARSDVFTVVQKLVGMFDVSTPTNSANSSNLETRSAVSKVRVDFIVDPAGTACLLLLSIGRAVMASNVNTKSSGGSVDPGVGRPELQKFMSLKSAGDMMTPPMSAASTAFGPPMSASAMSRSSTADATGAAVGSKSTATSDVALPSTVVTVPSTNISHSTGPIVLTPGPISSSTPAPPVAPTTALEQSFYPILETYLSLVKAKSALATKMSSLLFVDATGKFTVFATDSNLVLRKKTEASPDYVMRICFKTSPTTPHSEVVAYVNTASNATYDTHVNFSRRQALTRDECEALLTGQRATVGELDLGLLKREGMFVFGKVGVSAEAEAQPFLCECEFMNANSMTNIRFGQYNYSRGGAGQDKNVDWLATDTNGSGGLSESSRKNVQYSMKNIISMWDGEHIGNSSRIRVDFVLDVDGNAVILLISIAKTSAIPRRFSMASSKRMSIRQLPSSAAATSAEVSTKASESASTSSPSVPLSSVSSTQSVQDARGLGLASIKDTILIPASPEVASSANASAINSSNVSSNIRTRLTYSSTLETYLMLTRAKVTLPAKVSPLLFEEPSTNKYQVFASDSNLMIRRKTEASVEYIHRVCFRSKDSTPASEVLGYLCMPGAAFFRQPQTKEQCDHLLSTPQGNDILKQEGVFLFGRIAAIESPVLVCECDCSLEGSPIAIISSRFGQRNDTGTINWWSSQADSMGTLVPPVIQEAVLSCVKLVADAPTHSPGMAGTRLKVMLDFIIDEVSSLRVILISIDNNELNNSITSLPGQHGVSSPRSQPALQPLAPIPEHADAEAEVAHAPAKAVAAVNSALLLPTTPALAMGNPSSATFSVPSSQPTPMQTSAVVTTALAGAAMASPAPFAFLPTMTVYLTLVRMKLTLPLRSTALIFYDPEKQSLLAFSSDHTNTIRKKTNVGFEYVFGGFLGVTDAVQPTETVAHLHISHTTHRAAVTRSRCEALLKQAEVPGENTEGLKAPGDVFLYGRVAVTEVEYMCECMFSMTSGDASGVKFAKFVDAEHPIQWILVETHAPAQLQQLLGLSEAARVALIATVEMLAKAWAKGNNNSAGSSNATLRVDFTLDEHGSAVILLIAVGYGDIAEISASAATGALTSVSVPVPAGPSKRMTTIAKAPIQHAETFDPSLSHVPAPAPSPAAPAVSAPVTQPISGSSSSRCPSMSHILATYTAVAKQKTKLPLYVGTLVAFDPAINALVAFASDGELMLRKKSNVAPDYAMRIFLGITEAVTDAMVVGYVHTQPTVTAQAIDAADAPPCRKALTKVECKALLLEGLDAIKPPGSFVYARTEVAAGARMVVCECTFARDTKTLLRCRYGRVFDNDSVRWLSEQTEIDKRIPQALQQRVTAAAQILLGAAAAIVSSSECCTWIEVYVAENGDGSIPFMTVFDPAVTNASTNAGTDVAVSAAEAAKHEAGPVPAAAAAAAAPHVHGRATIRQQGGPTAAIAKPVPPSLEAPQGPMLNLTPSATPTPALATVPAPVPAPAPPVDSSEPVAIHHAGGKGRPTIRQPQAAAATASAPEAAPTPVQSPAQSVLDTYVAIVKAKTALPVRSSTLILKEPADSNSDPAAGAEPLYVAFSSDKNQLLRRKSNVNAEYTCNLFLRISEQTPDDFVVAFLHNTATDCIADRQPLTKVDCVKLLKDRHSSLRQDPSTVLYGRVAEQEPLYVCRCELSAASVSASKPAVQFGVRGEHGERSVTWINSNSPSKISAAAQAAIADTATALLNIWASGSTAGIKLWLDFTIDSEDKAVVLLVSVGDAALAVAAKPAKTPQASSLPVATPIGSIVDSNKTAQQPAPLPSASSAPAGATRAPAPAAAPAPAPAPVVTPVGDELHFFELIGCITKAKYALGLEILPTLIGTLGAAKYNLFYAPSTGTVVKQKNVSVPDIETRIQSRLSDAGASNANAIVAMITREGNARELLTQPLCSTQLTDSAWQSDNAFMQLVAGCVVQPKHKTLIARVDFPRAGIVSDGVLTLVIRNVEGKVSSTLDSATSAVVETSLDQSRIKRVMVALAEKLKVAKFKTSRLELELLQIQSQPQEWAVCNMNAFAIQSEEPIAPEIVEPAFASGPPTAAAAVAATASSSANPTATSSSTAAGTGAGGAAPPPSANKVKKGGIVTEGKASRPITAKDKDRDAPGSAGNDGTAAGAGAGVGAGEAGEAGSGSNSRVGTASSNRVKSAGWGSRPQTFVVSFVDVLSSATSAKVALDCGVLITCCTDARAASIQLLCTDKSFQIKRQKKADLEVVRGRISKIGAKKSNGVAFLYTKDGRRTPLGEAQCLELLEGTGEGLLNRIKDKDSFFQVASMTSLPTLVVEAAVNTDPAVPPGTLTSTKMRRRIDDSENLTPVDTSKNADVDEASKEATVVKAKIANVVKIMKEQLKFNVVDLVAELTVSEDECILMYVHFNVSLVSR